MRSHILVFIIITMLGEMNTSAKSYILNGGQKSKIKYRVVQLVEPSPVNIENIRLTYVQPQTFTSPTYNQRVIEQDITFSVSPGEVDSSRDKHGNHLVTYTWLKSKKPFTAEMSVVVENAVILKKISSKAPFPLKNIPAKNKPYLSSTAMVQARNVKIKDHAEKLVHGAKTEFDAVQKILTWLIDHMQYVLTPQKYDALYSLQSGKGNCQNYSHLAAALLRASDIPVRIANGITMKKPFDVTVGNGVLTLDMAQGRHSWIEIYFSDLGWVPFDPQQTELFVSNRFVRTEVGVDNEESSNDGLVRWTRVKGKQAMVSFHESIEAEFLTDEVSINGTRQKYGPRDIMLQPLVEAAFVPIIAAKTPEPVPMELEELLKLRFTIPDIRGNLEFPEGVNLAFVRESKTDEKAQTQVLTKNFLVETAEYVTGAPRFAQAFVLDKPLQLKKIGLALHKFGGNGTLWIELREDDNNAPGKIGAQSTAVELDKLSSKPGYFWVDFTFPSDKIFLTPDRYWIMLGYKGAPIVNWFYTYGKTIGPADGTRSLEKGETKWNRSLSYEFNYRIAGKIAE